MNWQAIGAVAELIGGVGVIASLFYLAIQIRQNTRSVRSASYHAVVANLSALSALSGAAGRDVDAANIMLAGGANPEILNPKEFNQFRLLMTSLFRSYENIFYQHSQGMIDSSVWRGWENSMTRLFWLPGVQEWWPGWRIDCQSEFRDFLESSESPVDASSE
jgi:hypothetical protein